MPVEARDGGVRVKVIAGSTSLGTSGPVTAAATDARYFDVEVPEGVTFTESLPAEHAAFAVVHEGTIATGGHDVAGVGLVQFGDGDAVQFKAVGGPAKALLIAGRPLGEPVAWHGPFVMNSTAELMQAIDDSQAGRF
jgi:redox-sensitive bicupin YhaK (pirin superfamily)